MTQQQCTASLFRAKCSPHCSVLLCQTGLQLACIYCNYTYEALLVIKVCSDPTPVHCITVLCKMQCTQVSAALQDRLAAGLYHCNYTYEALLVIQVCSDPTPVHCITVQGKMQSPLLSATLQDRLAAGMYHCNYTQCCSAIQACSRLVSLQLHL